MFFHDFRQEYYTYLTLQNLIKYFNDSGSVQYIENQRVTKFIFISHYLDPVILTELKSSRVLH